MGAPGSDKALIGIVKWAGRDEWAEERRQILDAHLEPLLNATGESIEDLADLLGDLLTPIFRSAFEDFLCCDFGPDQHNIVSEYLARRGFKESMPAKRYLVALQGSVMSVYEVMASTPGSHLVVRDLVRGGEPVQVEEKSGSRGLAPSDHIAARLLKVNGRTFMSGAVLPLPADEAVELAEQARDLCQKFRHELRQAAEDEGIAAAELEAMVALDDVALGEMAPLFSHVWMGHTLAQMAGPLLAEMNIDQADLAVDPQAAALATPVAELGGRSPQAAVRSKTGRWQVAQWLKYREAQSGEGAGGAADADLDWMWSKLRIEHLR